MNEDKQYLIKLARKIQGKLLCKWKKLRLYSYEENIKPQ